MLRAGDTRSGIERQLDGIMAIRACILDNGPRDHDGGMSRPYRALLDAIDRDIEKLTSWLGFESKLTGGPNGGH
jgi:hypothetical protein